MIAFLRGVLPATVLPFREDLSVDHDGLASLVAHLAQTPGVTGIVANAVAGESTSLSGTEPVAVIRTVVARLGRTPVIAGIAEEQPAAAARAAAAAQEAGASAVLVQAPASFARGIGEAPEVALSYFREIDRVGVPLIVFQHQVSTGRNYPIPLLLALTELTNVIAVKETIWDVALYEREVVALRQHRPELVVLCANDTLLLPSLAAASPDGLLLGFATLVPGPIGELFDAVRAGDLTTARAIHDRLRPIRDAIYASPSIGYYPRVKAALRQLGVMSNAIVRPPLIAPSEGELARIHAALEASELLEPASAVRASAGRSHAVP